MLWKEVHNLNFGLAGSFGAALAWIGESQCLGGTTVLFRMVKESMNKLGHTE